MSTVGPLAAEAFVAFEQVLAYSAFVVAVAEDEVAGVEGVAVDVGGAEGVAAVVEAVTVVVGDAVHAVVSAGDEDVVAGAEDAVEDAAAEVAVVGSELFSASTLQP